MVCTGYNKRIYVKLSFSPGIWNNMTKNKNNPTNDARFHPQTKHHRLELTPRRLSDRPRRPRGRSKAPKGGFKNNKNSSSSWTYHQTKMSLYHQIQTSPWEMILS